MEIRQRPDGTLIAIPEGRQPSADAFQIPQAMFVPSTWNAETRTIDVVLVDERTATVRKFDWATFDFVDETLSLDASAVRLERLNNGAPVLRTHDSRDAFAQLGKVVEGSGRIEGKTPERQLVATFAFSPNLDEGNERIVQDVAMGFRSHISVGFDPHVVVVEQRDDGPNHHRVIDWTPLEGSIVPIGADDNATTRSRPEPAQPEKRGDTMPLTPEEIAKREADEKAAMEAEIERRAKERADAQIAARKARDAKIDRLGNVLQLDADKVREYRERDESFEVISDDMVAVAAERQAAANEGIRNTLRVEAGEYDERDIDDLRMVSYLFCHRFNPDQAEKKLVESLTKREDSDTRHVAKSVTLDTLREFNWRREGQEYYGSRLIDLARRCLERQSPGCTRRKSPEWIARRALNTTSGFPLLLAEVLNASVDLGFAEYPLDARWSRRTTIADFRNKYNVTMGEAAELLPLGEDGEILSSTIREKRENYKLITYARGLGLTRELIINDHLGGLTDIPSKLGEAAMRKMRLELYKIVLGSDFLTFTGTPTDPVMADGQPLFSTATGNRTYSNISAAGIPTIENLNLARVAMATRPGLGNVDETDPTVQFAMRYVLVAEKWIDRIEQELGIAERGTLNRADGAGIEKQITSRLRGLQPIADAFFDQKDFGGGLGNGWVATDGRAVEHAFLEGSEGMQVAVYSPEGKLGTRIDAWLDFGAGAVSHRGVQLNPGAAS